jgi:protein involved in polysaccharide export with SLBB domain
MIAAVPTSLMRAHVKARVISLAAAGAFALSCLFSEPAAAQKTPPAGAQRATRAELKQRVALLEQPGTSRPASPARAGELAAIRDRLAHGDFKPGDRFILTLRQDSVRSDTLVVRDSLRVAVLNLPEFSVDGLLRSELEDALNAHVTRFLRNAVVRAALLVRVSVIGAVQRPGFYYALPDGPINDLLTSAGGPAAEADLKKITVTRLGKEVVGGKASKNLLESGMTLEQLDVQNGDTVRLPLKRKFNYQLIIQLFFILSTLFFAVIQFLQWYYGRTDQ